MITSIGDANGDATDGGASPNDAAANPNDAAIHDDASALVPAEAFPLHARSLRPGAQRGFEGDEDRSADEQIAARPRRQR